MRLTTGLILLALSIGLCRAAQQPDTASPTLQPVQPNGPTQQPNNSLNQTQQLNSTALSTEEEEFEEDEVEELPVPEQQVGNRRRLLIGGDVTDTLDDIATQADESVHGKNVLPSNHADRPRNMNRRRRKRKRIQPRPVYADDDIPTSTDDPSGDSTRSPEGRPLIPHRDRPRIRENEDDERPLLRDRPRVRQEDEDRIRDRPRTEEDDGERPLFRDRPRIQDDDNERPPLRNRQRINEDDERPRLRGENGDEERPLRRERPRPQDGDDLPRLRERPYRPNEERPQRPLRRRRKNRRRPNLETPVDGLPEEAMGNNEFIPRRERLPPVSRDEPDEGELREIEPNSKLEEEPIMLRERNRDPADISLGSLRGEESMPRSKTFDDVPVTEMVLVENINFPGPRLTNNGQDDVSHPVETVSKRPRRRRLRPRVQRVRNETIIEEQKEKEEKIIETTTMLVDEVLSDGEALQSTRPDQKLQPTRNKEKVKIQNTNVQNRDEVKDVETKGVGVNIDITEPLIPIKISLSDLLRDKNISIEDILKDSQSEKVNIPSPTRPKPKLPITAKQLVRAKLTDLSRGNRQREKPSKIEQNDSTTQNIETTTQKLPTIQKKTPTQRSTSTTQRSTSTTPRTTATSTKHTRQQTSSTTRKEITTPRGITEDQVHVTRMPMLTMQETEDIDPIKMSDKSATKNNSKAAQFLKTRVRLPPTGVYFPSIKLAKGLRGSGQQNSTTTDQEALPSRETSTVRRTNSDTHSQKDHKPTEVVIRSSTESNKLPVNHYDSNIKEEIPKLPVYVVNPKFHKSYQADTLPPTETNIIPAPELNAYGSYKEAKKPYSAEATTTINTEPLRLNIPLKMEPEETSSETTVSHVKSAEDEIVELLMAENGSGRLSRILASRNMTLSELIEHRERGASQQRISDIFLGKKSAGEELELLQRENKGQSSKPLDVKTVPKLEELFNINKDVPNLADGDGTSEYHESKESAKRVPRVFEGLQPFKPIVTVDPIQEQESKEMHINVGEETMYVKKTEPGLEYKETDMEEKDESSVETKNELDVESKEAYPDVEEDEEDYSETYRGNGKIENAGKVREIRTKVSHIEHNLTGLPAGMKSILLASSAVLGLAIFVFLAIFITCKVRRHKRVRSRYAHRRGSMIHHDIEKSRSMSPVLINTGYKDMTDERRYYLWNTIRKTLRYK